MEMRNLAAVLMPLWKNPEESETKLQEFKALLRTVGPQTIQDTQNFIIAAINFVLNYYPKEHSQSRKIRCLITEIFQILFDKSRINSVQTFFFAYYFLLNEIYDPTQSTLVATVSEEYKLLIIQSTTSLFKALTWDATKSLYTPENSLKLCEMVYTVNVMAKTEQFRSLRLACIECIMALAKVDTIDSSDIEMREQIANCFMHFAPGIISGLGDIATEDEKHGHATASLAVHAWGKIVVLLTQNYNQTDCIASQIFMLSMDDEPDYVPKSKWKNKEQLENHLKNAKRTTNWCKTTDKNLQSLMAKFKKLTCHSHQRVRLELVNTCMQVIEYSSFTIPVTVSKAIENLIILVEDEDHEISNTSKTVLESFSNKFFTNIFKSVLENLEENFYNVIASLPRVFNGLDEKEQLASINLLIGYLQLFGKTKLIHVLHSATHLRRLIETLIHISELESKNISLYEEYMISDLDLVADYRTPWKSFRYLQGSAMEQKFQKTCALLAKCKVLDITTDLLLDIFMNSQENRKEATLILNDVLFGLLGSPHISEHIHIIKSVINTYLEPEYWNLELDVSYTCMLPQVQNNILQICLQVEGISKIALAMKSDFKQFLFKVLYPILERAGSGHPLIKVAGTTAIVNVSVACGYANVTQLIEANSDYFSYNVIRKIKKTEYNETALNVLAVVMKYGNLNVLSSISDIIQDVLFQTLDRFFQNSNATAYLRVFQIFVNCLMKWLNIAPNIEPIKSKLQKKLEYEEFKVSGLNQNFDVDEDKGKSAEEMYREDMAKNKSEFECDDYNTEEYAKPKPPDHVQLTVSLLQRCLHFLPSKDRNCKLLVIDILNNGFEIIRDWEDELLPLVHQVWSPLTERFKEKDDSLIINYSFQLLVTLARLSKDFIRSRTAKDILPHIRKILKTYSKSSYLQDKGSAYRYTQAYKLQLHLLKHLSRVIMDIDLGDEHVIFTMEAVLPYLSDKQPLPLQEASLIFYQDLAKYDLQLVQKILHRALNTQDSDQVKLEYKRNLLAVLKTM